MNYPTDNRNQCQIPTLPAIYDKYLGYRTSGRFVEVGAFDGKQWSNTWMLAELGWHGLYVEPHPEHYVSCVANHAKHPNVVCENVACGKSIGTTKLFLGGAESTICESTIEQYASEPTLALCGLNIDKYVTVEVTTLERLLIKHYWPFDYDVLVVDVEGAELDVLQNAGFHIYRPTLAIVETHELSTNLNISWKAEPISIFFESYNYDKIYADHINTIFVDRRKDV